VLGGVAFALGAPPTDLVAGLFVGLALLGAAAHGAPSTARAFGRGLAWGTAAGLVGLRFVPAVITRFTPLGPAPAALALVLLAAAQAVPWGIAAAVTAALGRRAHAPLPLALAAGVFVALLCPTIFAWSPAGLATPWPALVQAADLVGERGVSAIFGAVAGLLASGALALGRPGPLPARLRAASPRVAAAIAIVVGLIAHGALRMLRVEAARAALPTARVGLVDVAVGPHERWNPRNHVSILARLREATARAEADGAELVVWPEGAYPFVLDHGARRVPPRGPRAPLADGVHGPILMGLIMDRPPVALGAGGLDHPSWNAAAIVGGDGSLSAPYDKVELLWFGETVPGSSLFPWLRRTFQKSGGLVPGDGPRALELAREAGPALRMEVLNCYEDTLPALGRGHARAIAPNLVVNVTNDAWFFGTAEPELHARLGAMRAIELRRDVVRAVNLGVASWVSASGRVLGRWDSPEPGVLMAEPALSEAGPTPYVRFGDAPTALVLALAAMASAWAARRRASATATGPSAP
jgi:apolipoprotein N-acyltransferase